MKAFITHFVFDFKNGLRDSTLLLMNYLFPLGFFLMIGLVMTKLNPTFQENLVPAMTVFTVLASTVLGMPNILVSSRELGIFRSYKINGVPALHILGIPSLSVFIHSLIVTTIIVITGPIFFGGSSPTNLFGFLISFILIVFASTGLSLLIGTISKDTRTTVLWSQLIFLPSMLLGGLMVPSNTLPESLSFFGKLIPSTYSMNIFKSLAFNRTSDFSVVGSILVLLFGGLISFLLSLYLFKWDNNDSKKSKKTLLALIAILPYLLGAIFCT